MALDLKRLGSAAVVAEEGNLSRAALRLKVSQPALSRRIQELERELQFSLFEQAGRGIRLTGEGQAFLKKCSDLLALAESIEDQARSFASGDIGVLRIGATPQSLERLFPKLLSRYTARFPRVEVELFEDNQRDLQLRLERGEIHLALASFLENERIESRDLAPAFVLAAMARGHPLSGVRQIDINDLGDTPILVLKQGSKTREKFDAASRLAHVEPRIVLESGAPQSILALAEMGLGIAIVPSTVRIERWALHMAPICHRRKPLEMRLAICWSRGRYLAPYVQQFIEETSKVAKEEFTPVGMEE